MIATGTDIKPLEVLLFLRHVRSRVYFEQMKGRGTRALTVNKVIAYGFDAAAKEKAEVLVGSFCEYIEALRILYSRGLCRQLARIQQIYLTAT